MSRNKLRALVPALCALWIVLLTTVLKPAHVSDSTLGFVVGVFLGISVLAVIKLRPRAS